MLEQLCEYSGVIFGSSSKTSGIICNHLRIISYTFYSWRYHRLTKMTGKASMAMFLTSVSQSLPHDSAHNPKGSIINVLSHNSASYARQNLLSPQIDHRHPAALGAGSAPRAMGSGAATWLWPALGKCRKKHNIEEKTWYCY